MSSGLVKYSTSIPSAAPNKLRTCWHCRLLGYKRPFDGAVDCVEPAHTDWFPRCSLSAFLISSWRPVFASRSGTPNQQRSSREGRLCLGYASRVTTTPVPLL